MSTKYQKVVAAAVAETQSKFQLAEALALEIPPRRPGPTNVGERPVTECLMEAALQIKQAGGEDRSWETLARYRELALWISGDLAGDFRWIKGVSFSAHLEGNKAGLTYHEFATMPKKTVEAVRERNGQPKPSEAPPRVIETWTPAQKAVAARELLADPDVVSHAQVREAIVERASSSSALTAQTVERASEKRPVPVRPAREPSGLDYASALGVGTSAVVAMRRLAEDVSALVAAMRNDVLRATDADAIQEDITGLRKASDMARMYAEELEVALSGGVSDDRLRALLESGM